MEWKCNQWNICIDSADFLQVTMKLKHPKSEEFLLSNHRTFFLCMSLNCSSGKLLVDFWKLWMTFCHWRLMKCFTSSVFGKWRSIRLNQSGWEWLRSCHLFSIVNHITIFDKRHYDLKNTRDDNSFLALKKSNRNPHCNINSNEKRKFA